MKVNYLPNRRVKSDQVIKVIKEHVIGGKNVSKGLEELQRCAYRQLIRKGFETDVDG